MKVSRVEIARIFDVSEPSIRNWLNEATPLPRENHEYDTRTCINWFTDRAIRKKLGDGEDGVYSLETERARLAHHQANNEALKEAQLKGDLIQSGEVQKQWSDAVLSMRNKMLSLPSKLAKIAINADSVREIEREAERLVHESLQELLIYERKSDSSADESAGTGQTATKVDNQRVGGQAPKAKPRSQRRARTVAD